MNIEVSRSGAFRVSCMVKNEFGNEYREQLVFMGYSENKAVQKFREYLKDNNLKGQF